MGAKPSNKVERDVHWLKMYAVFMTLVVAALGVTAFTGTATSGNVQVLDVERINVVESDGTLRMTISNSARLPDPILDGKAYPIRSGARAAGMIFFNDVGDETGGLIFSGTDSANGNRYHASGSLTFDQHKQDQVVQISHRDVKGRRVAGVRVYDRPDAPLAPILDTIMTIRQLPDGSEKTRRMEEFRQRRAERGEVSAVRLFAGKNADKATVVELSDPKGRPRLVLRVDSTGAAGVEFLDETGVVVSRLP
jgi:hypothetical protein